MTGHTYYSQKGSLLIGRDVFEADSDYGFYDGYMDELRIYDRALNEAEVGELYQIGVDTSNSTLSGGHLKMY